MLNIAMVVGLIKALAPVADPSVIEQAVDDYLEAHPEITVADGSITEEKLASDVLLTMSTLESDVSDVKTAIHGINDGGKTLTPDVKTALINLFSHVTYTDGNAQQYINALQTAWQPSAVLVSITADFEQGSAVIEEGDSLDTLKQYLTVIGNYTTFTQEITDYTLSGSLVAGTSTITVTVGLLTTTFTVDVTAYSDYEYYTKLISTGDQYIDPNLTEEDLAGCYYEYKCRPNSERASSGHILSSQYTFVAFPQVNSGNKRWSTKIKGGSEKASSNGAWTNNTDYTVVAFADENNSVKVNGDTLIASVTPGSSGTSSNKFALLGYGGAMDTAYYRFRGALYYLKIFNSSDVLIHHFVPAKKKSTSKYGLYDYVTENFFSSATSTEFTVE